MVGEKPHYLMLLETSTAAPNHGRWRCVLEQTATGQLWEAEDVEPGTVGERLELLAAVRGLEALPKPSRVTLVTTSRLLEWILCEALPRWRSDGTLAVSPHERFPKQNLDLWRRIDRALRYHDLECRRLGAGACADDAALRPYCTQPKSRLRHLCWGWVHQLRTQWEEWISRPAHRWSRRTIHKAAFALGGPWATIFVAWVRY